jgi:hypothetical protein
MSKDVSVFFRIGAQGARALICIKLACLLQCRLKFQVEIPAAAGNDSCAIREVTAMVADAVAIEPVSASQIPC